MNQPLDDDRQAEFSKLLDDLCNGTLEAEGHARFQALLKADRSLLEQYLARIDLHFDLKRIYAAPEEDRLSTHSAALFCEILEQEVAAAPEPTRSSLAWLTPMPLATLAARILIGVSLVILCTQGFLNQSNQARRPASQGSVVDSAGGVASAEGAQLTQISRAKFFGQDMPPLQSTIHAGREYALSEGMIELTFPSSATAIIEAPAVFQIIHRERMLLKAGVCSVHAPPGAQGFRVDTPTADVIDLGTRFVVDVAQSGGTKVQVVEGEADVFATATATDPNRSSLKWSMREHEARWIDVDKQVVTSHVDFVESDYKRALPDRITDFEATEREGGIDELQSVSVQRNGVLHRYDIDELIGVELIHYRGATSSFMVTPSTIEDNATPGADEHQSRRRFADNDRSLCSGLINPGGQLVPITTSPTLNRIDQRSGSSPKALGTPGIGFRFRTPVINDSGPDMVVFELQTIVNSEKGDAFHISPLELEDNLHATTVRRYDIDLSSPQSRFLSPYRLYRADEVIDSLDMALGVVHREGRVHGIRAKITAVAIDFSSMGFADGAVVNGVFLQDAADDADNFDPVFVAGLPASH